MDPDLEFEIEVKKIINASTEASQRYRLTEKGRQNEAKGPARKRARRLAGKKRKKS